MKPLDSTTDQWLTSVMFLVAATLGAVTCELHAVEGMWLKPGLHSYGIDAYLLPLFIAVPAFSGFAIRWRTKKWIGTGDMSSTVAATINSVMGGALLVTYICILSLEKLAF
jgi:hypothetical protein